MGNPGGQAGEVDGGNRVAAADDRHCAAVGDGFSHAEGAFGEVGHFEHAHRAIPDDRAGAGEGEGKCLDRGGTDIQDAPASGDVANSQIVSGLRSSSNLSAMTTSTGKLQLAEPAPSSSPAVSRASSSTSELATARP